MHAVRTARAVPVPVPVPVPIRAKGKRQRAKGKGSVAAIESTHPFFVHTGSPFLF